MLAIQRQYFLSDDFFVQKVHFQPLIFSKILGENMYLI